MDAATQALNAYLQSSRPANDAGLTISSVTNDCVGTTRPHGSTYDIGAYEYVRVVGPTITAMSLPKGQPLPPQLDVKIS
jgi:hypothetical protein